MCREARYQGVPKQEKPRIHAKMCKLGGRGPHAASYRGCSNFPEIKSKVTEGLDRKEKPVNTNAKIPNQIAQLDETPKNTETVHPPSQETVNFSHPQDLQANKEELGDLFRLLKQMQVILSKVPDVKKTLEEMEKTEDPSNKLFILVEELNDNI
ncbi:hypothetical protein AVEN_190739-1 [Araneus ventricosus]|uniref:Uncharacterized protein n=1 Tax=Araneus ventricosus TaxID=182803 RepID=A0A4Y2Q9I5_ARAVE|nr:hypothetical protein AVEN_255810-1 [Araneus ventricosus]GBN60212.1 hypothetical protein AVEN_160217-1 [Araneus ventricosus]GBN60229.1 hypothetical protein AVEN_190739-1 [Araneus ventricosus]